MNYEQLNKQNRTFMKREMKKDLNFEWEDDKLTNILLKKLDMIYPYSGDPQKFIDDKKYLNEINSLINELNDRRISNTDFLEKLTTKLNALLKQYPELSYQNKYNIETYNENLSISNRLLIVGDGGIGKSYYIYKFEERLIKNEHKHLVIYCKYTKSIEKEIIAEIQKMKNEFYLVIDAFNELEIKEQKNMLLSLKKLANNKNINIIVSYRTNNLSVDIKNELENLLINKYKFKGVNYESSLLKIIETFGIEVVDYIDVIETNNPLYLQMLNQILTDPKMTKKNIADLVQITFILESYIKSICGLDAWEKTKKIGKYMFDHSKEYIEETELYKILGNETNEYIDKMIKNNIADIYIFDDKNRFIFKIQRLSDYIIARSLHKEITDLSDDEIIKVINEKISKMYSLKEIIIILLFDRFKKNDINRAIDIISKSELYDEFNLNVFRKMNFNQCQINKIQKVLSVDNWNDAFLKLGGYPNRPFNCSNFTNEIMVSDNKKIYNLKLNYIEQEIIIKLKNILYNIIFINKDNIYIAEYFKYTFWLTSVSNQKIRNLSIKIIYDICNKFNRYGLKLINLYDTVEEKYLKKGIIQVIVSLEQEEKYVKFLEKVLKDPEEIDAENISRIAKYLEFKDIPLLNKRNLYLEFEKREIDAAIELNHIINMGDIHEKYLLKFKRYGKENTLSLHHNFILNDTLEIKKYNALLQEKFKCVSTNGWCKYSSSADEFKKFLPQLNLKQIDINKMFVVYQEIFKKISKNYDYNYNIIERFDFHINKFSNSLLRKILLLSQDILLGSLMSNYYTDEFSVYNDNVNFGYIPYYFSEGSDNINICSPVSIYNEDIDHLNAKICKNLNLYEEKSMEWYKDSGVSLANVKKMVDSIKYDGFNWNLIYGDIHMYESDYKNRHIYTEVYNYTMAVNENISLKGDSNSRKLTIENEEYFGNIYSYKKENFSKSVRIPPIQVTNKDFNETYLMFPPSAIIKEFDLIYDRKYSTWKTKQDEIVLICDNNYKEYYNSPITGAIYIKANFLDRIKKKHNIKFWAYTEKNYMDKGWNEEASLHIELNNLGENTALYRNNSLINSKETFNDKCKNCKFSIYQNYKNSIYDSEKLKISLYKLIEDSSK